MINTNIDFKKIEKALIRLYGKIEIIEELQKHKGDKFNIFSILKIENLEVNTHSTFLYELLNPKGTHYQDTKYLKIFIDEVLEIENFDFNNVEVDRETHTSESRRIDFTIKNKDYYIAIEMKIGAKDQNNQLNDYSEYIQTQNRDFKKLYYLTLDGRNASENSIKNKKELVYEKISFEFHILKFIETSIEQSTELPIIRESLIQYRNLILKITNQATKELQMESIKYINTPEMVEAATIMSKNLAYAWAKKEVLFWEKLEQKLNVYLKNKQSCELLPYNIAMENILDEILDIRAKNKDLGLKINFPKNSFYFLIYSYSKENFMYQIEFENKNDIEKVAVLVDFKSKFHRARYTQSKYKLNFCKDYDEPSYYIFDDKKLDKVVDNIYDEIKTYIDIIYKELN